MQKTFPIKYPAYMVKLNLSIKVIESLLLFLHYGCMIFNSQQSYFISFAHLSFYSNKNTHEIMTCYLAYIWCEYLESSRTHSRKKVN